MDCATARHYISRMCDGELNNGEKRELARHIEVCADCAGYARRCEQLQELMRSSCVNPPDDTCWSDLVNKIEGRIPRHRTNRPPRHPGA